MRGNKRERLSAKKKRSVRVCVGAGGDVVDVCSYANESGVLVGEVGREREMGVACRHCAQHLNNLDFGVDVVDSDDDLSLTLRVMSFLEVFFSAD